MNLLPLVFSIMLIFSYGYYAIWDKEVSGIKLRKTYASHHEANRDILNKFESEYYRYLGRKQKPPSGEKRAQTDSKKKEKQKKIPRNWECARINLWPLIQEGREKHPTLYELSCKLLRTFYGPLFPKESRFETYLLDALLSCAKKTSLESFSLEKITFEDPKLQFIYYKMLKGTKEWDLQKGIGYPPILSYVKAEPGDEKICVFHAHPDMVTVLFDSKIAEKLYADIHMAKTPLTRELIQRICFEMHSIALNADLMDLLQLSNYFSHKDKKPLFFASSGDVKLRKNLSIPRKK